MNFGVYMRYSTNQQEIKVQKDQIDKYISVYLSDKDNKFREYIDEGYSGKDMNRGAMERLKTDIVAGKIQSVVALKLHRLSRSLHDLLMLFDFFKEHNIVVHLVEDKIDTSTPQGRLLFQMTGAFAEYERAVIAERLAIGREYAKKHGTRTGKPLHRPRKQIDIRECISLYKKGLSLNKLGKLFKVHPITIKKRLIEHNVYEEKW